MVGYMGYNSRDSAHLQMHVAFWASSLLLLSWVSILVLLFVVLDSHFISLCNSWCQLGAGVYYGRLKGVGVNLGRGVNLGHTVIKGRWSAAACDETINSYCTRGPVLHADCFTIDPRYHRILLEL